MMASLRECDLSRMPRARPVGSISHVSRDVTWRVLFSLNALGATHDAGVLR